MYADSKVSTIPYGGQVAGSMNDVQPSMLERIAVLEKMNEDLREQLSRRDNEFEERLARVEHHVGCREPLPPSECKAPNRY